MIAAGRIFVASLVALLAVVTSALSQTVDGYALITIAPDGQAIGINNRGEVVGSFVTADGIRAFVWRKGTLVDLGGRPGSSFAVASAINEPGQIVGYSDAGAGTEDHAILWHKGQVIDLGTLPGGNTSRAFAINNRGTIAGMSTDANLVFRPVVWERGQAVDLGTPAGFTSGSALDINERGQIVGYASPADDSGMRAVLWDNGAAINLGTLPGDTESVALGINNRGQIVGFSRNVQAGTVLSLRAFIWEDGVMTELFGPPGTVAQANDINNSGRIAGNLNITTSPRAAVSDGGILQSLGGTEASLALSLNNRGDIVGISGNAAVVWRRQ